LCWGLILQDGSLIEDGATVAEEGRLREIMSDKHGRHSPRMQEFGKLAHETPARGLVERSEWFVEK
jgi:hypothetical protein